MPEHAGGISPGGSRPRPREHRLLSPRRLTPAVRRNLSQLFCALVGAGLGLLAPLITAGPRADVGRVVSVLFTLGFGVISLVSIIYSVLFLVVQFSASTFTPRLSLFRHEPVVWRTFAFTIGVFVFCITAALAVGSQRKVSALVPGAAMVLTLVALALMRTLQMRAFDSIQLGHSLSAIAVRAYRLYDTLYARPFTRAADAAPPPRVAGSGTPIRWTGPPAVLQTIDVSALVEAARTHDFSVAFRVAPGTTLSEGTVIAEVTGGGAGESAVRAALTTGVERTFAQDPGLPFRLLVDIALRALSPAINDPATAVEALDRIEGLLVRLAGSDLDVGRFHDSAGRTRVAVPVPGWDDYVRLAVDDVVHAAAGAPMVLRRTRDLLRSLLELTPEDRREPVADRLLRVDRTGRTTYSFVWD
ncbi:DUF2254 family protein [Streptomyces sp. NPDC004830]